MKIFRLDRNSNGYKAEELILLSRWRGAKKRKKKNEVKTNEDIWGW